VSTGTITNWLKNSYRIPFHKFVVLVNYVFDNDQEVLNTFTSEYLEKIDKVEYIKEGIEWYFTKGESQKAEKLIFKHSIESDDEAIKIYDVLCKRNKNLITTEDFYRIISNFKFNNLDNDTVALIKIAEMYAHLDFQSYKMLDFLIDEGLIFLSNVNNEYFKQTFELRMLEMKAIINFKRNNIVLANDICHYVIEKFPVEYFPIPICAFYTLLSEINSLHNYYLAIEYINKAFSILDKTEGDYKKWINILESTHDFINIYHGKYNNLFLTNKAEQAHYFAKIGKKETALNILSELQEKNGSSTAFQIYYKALATNSNEIMKTARDLFLSKGNLFYSQITDVDF